MKILKTILLLVTISIFSNCSKWDEANVKIERFEYLDHFYRKPYKNDSLSSEAYLIHGYKSKYDDKIHEITDRYICDSIISNLKFYHRKNITFYKKTKNTNRENFQIRPKHKMIRAESNDKLYSYKFTFKDSTLLRIRKQKYGLSEPDPPSQTFNCD